MDTNEQHFDLDGPKIDNSVAMTLANDIIDPLNGSNDPSFGAMDSPRGCNETAGNFAPLDDIIKDLYDIKPPSPTVTYPSVSSTCHNQMPNYASPINNNVCLGNYINNEHYYIVPNLNDSMNNFPSSSGQHYLSSSQLSTESVPDTMVPMTTNLPVVNNLPTSTTMIRNILEEDNDPSPVYLDLSIDNMTPQVSNFTKFCPQVNTNNMGFQKQSASEDQNLRYMEYLGENGESAKIKYLDNTISSTTGVMKSFEAKTNNYSFQTNEVCHNNYLYAHSQTIPREMGNNLIEDIYVNNNNKMEPIYENNNCEDLNKSGCVNIPVNDSLINEEMTAVNQTINSPEIIVCRPPLKTKTIKAKSQPIYVETEENIPSNLHLKYFAALNEKNIKIPIIINRSNSIKKKRKEKLKIRDLEDDFLFESINLLQEDTKSNEKESSPPLPDTPCSNKKGSDLSEESFLRKRKRKNHDVTKENEDWSDTDSSNNSPGDTKSTEKVPKSMKSNESNDDRDSYKIRTSKRIKKMYIPKNECKSDSISTSSSESDDHSPIASKSKCLKCKKLFKTPRSLTIHKKRCSVGVEIESDVEVTMADYLESEKESDDDNDEDNDDDNDDNDCDNNNEDDGDDTDEASLVSTKSITTSVSAVENIEDIKETNIKNHSPKSDAVENCETIEIEQNPFRRCTRSQTNLNASTKQSCQNVEDVIETKPKGKRQTQSKEKADKAAPATRTRNLRRKKN